MKLKIDLNILVKDGKDIIKEFLNFKINKIKDEFDFYYKSSQKFVHSHFKLDGPEYMISDEDYEKYQE